MQGSSVSPFSGSNDLTFPHHVHRLNSFQSSLGCVKSLEALRCSHLLLDEPVVLFNHIVEIFHSPKFTIFGHNLFVLRRSESLWISSVLINRDREWEPSVIGSHHLLEEAFCRRNIAFGTEHKLDSLTFFIHCSIEIFALLPNLDVGLINTIGRATHLQV